eukprot:gene3518-3973_t
MSEGTRVTVSVRIRPTNEKEKDTSSAVSARGNKIVLKGLDCGLEHKEFSFDQVFDQGVKQTAIFEKLGVQILDNVFEGYNACLFAYGQTGSGKTHTMLGFGNDLGVIPRLCWNLFQRIGEKKKKVGADGDGHTYQTRVEVEYFEIYDEKSSKHKALRIREHPERGPYVEGLTRSQASRFPLHRTCTAMFPVDTADAIQKVMAKGNKERTTAATAMNDTSSRSHAVFIITFQQSTLIDGVVATSK